MSHKRIKTAIAASSTTVTDLFGVGPIIASTLIGYTGYIRTAPVKSSSGDRTLDLIDFAHTRVVDLDSWVDVPWRSATKFS